MVFYRKYRPQTIEELDSKDVRDKLHSVLSGQEIPHAFLFTGPKGLGKTSTARILAKSINCEKKKKGIEPCNECEQCKSISNGTNMDILEIDGASNRGIDEIRDLREKLKLSPMSAKKKVYIIDEVHMLTTEAFNALLKTLEEPPSHVVFVLCTTEPHKVPETILSRCLRIQFKKATGEELIRSFERIIKAENLEADKDTLSMIANLSDGSFRDGVKILEEMALASKNKKINKELIEKNYLVASMHYQIAQIVKAFEDKDVKRGFEVAAKLTNDGIDMSNFMVGLIETLHGSMLHKIGVETKTGLGIVIDDLKLEVFEIKKIIELLSRARAEFRYAVLPQIPLELAIVEWCSVVEEKNQNEKIIGSQNRHQPGPVGLHPRPTASVTSLPAGFRQGSPAPVTRPDDSTPKITQQEMEKYSEHDALWTALIDKVKLHNHSVAGVLRGCRIKSYDNKMLVLETNFKFHKDRLSDIKTKNILDQAIKEVTKKDVTIEIVLKGVNK